MDKKIEETREFLQTIGMPKAQQADICCYVILAMAGIKPDMSWSEVTNEWIRIHDIIQFVNTPVKYIKFIYIRIIHRYLFVVSIHVEKTV